MDNRRSVGAEGRVRAADQVSTRQFDEEWILLDLARGDYFGLDELAGAIWGYLLKGMSPREIADQLVNGYDVEREVLLRDIIRFTDELVDRQLVRALPRDERV